MFDEPKTKQFSVSELCRILFCGFLLFQLCAPDGLPHATVKKFKGLREGNRLSTSSACVLFFLSYASFKMFEGV